VSRVHGSLLVKFKVLCAGEGSEPRNILIKEIDDARWNAMQATLTKEPLNSVGVLMLRASSKRQEECQRNRLPTRLRVVT
jgi:hypothetical protein